MNAINSALAPETQMQQKPTAGCSTVSYELPNPQQLRQQLPVSEQLAEVIAHQRNAVCAVLNQTDNRLLVVVEIGRAHV